MARLWRRDRRELGVLALTFGVSVARTVELALLGGALASLAVLLRDLMRPRLLSHHVKVRALHRGGALRSLRISMQ